ncbi:MAG: phosphohistidine phosphatase SixA [Thermaceae bacterium]|nr:phosphohistidine phosphatase SixA [Thermaceae bacterium]
MELYLIRHAIAEEALPGQADDARPLSPEGVKRFRRVVQGLKRLKLGFDRLYHSPKLRAVQTANLLTPLLEGESEVTPYLAEPPSPKLLKLLQGEKVALVGHEPWLGQLCALLICSDSQVGGGFGFKKGGVAHLEGRSEPGGMRLLAFLPPKVLGRL